MMNRITMLKRLQVFALTLPLCALSVISAETPKCHRTPKVILGLDEKGLPTQKWLDAIRDRITPEEFNTITITPRPLTQNEKDWLDLITIESVKWCRTLDRLNAPFPMVKHPETVTVLIGNQGGNDGFTGGDDAVAMDLQDMVHAYGPSSAEGNSVRVRKLLSHEYTHLLLHPFLDSNGWKEEQVASDPYLQAIRVLFNEGIANLRSIDEDSTWVDASGALTAHSREVLATLQPRMIERLQGLRASPSPDAAKQLMRNISQGPFAGKWGALPIALWLAEDTRGDPKKLTRWINAKPQGILQLGVLHADASLWPAFQDLSKTAEARTRSNQLR